MEKAATKRWKAQWKAAEAWLTFPPEVSSLKLMPTNFVNRLFSGDGNAVYSASFCAPRPKKAAFGFGSPILSLMLRGLLAQRNCVCFLLLLTTGSRFQEHTLAM